MHCIKTAIWTYAESSECDNYFTNPSDLLPVITRILTTKSDKQPFPAVQPQRFAGILDQVAGFT